MNIKLKPTSEGGQRVKTVELTQRHITLCEEVHVDLEAYYNAPPEGSVPDWVAFLIEIRLPKTRRGSSGLAEALEMTPERLQALESSKVDEEAERLRLREPVSGEAFKRAMKEALMGEPSYIKFRPMKALTCDNPECRKDFYDPLDGPDPKKFAIYCPHCGKSCYHERPAYPRPWEEEETMP